MSYGYKKAPELPELHTRLYQVLLDYPPVSARKSEDGVYKAIDSTGNVYLVHFSEGASGHPGTTKKRVMDYDALLKRSSSEL